MIFYQDTQTNYEVLPNNRPRPLPQYFLWVSKNRYRSDNV